MFTMDESVQINVLSAPAGRLVALLQYGERGISEHVSCGDRLDEQSAFTATFTNGEAAWSGCCI